MFYGALVASYGTTSTFNDALVAFYDSIGILKQSSEIQGILMAGT